MSSKQSSKAQDMGELFTTVKFNVGGKIYEVAKSLLEEYPDTVLAKKANEPSSPFLVFIDRDPDRFAFCLDYMRDHGNVYLPETVSKSAILKELEFYGFVNIDETKICDGKSQENFFDRFHQVSKECKQRIVQLENEVTGMQEEAQNLENARRRKMVKIKIEKLVLKCLAASVESTADHFYVNYKDMHGLQIANVKCDPYFVERCDKVGLCVADVGVHHQEMPSTFGAPSPFGMATSTFGMGTSTFGVAPSPALCLRRKTNFACQK